MEQARSSKIAMVNQDEKELLRRPSGKRLLPGIQAKLRQCMENYLDIKRKYEQGTVAEYD